MIFITENEIREKYTSSPFQHYRQQEGIKLTPAARQFLLDKRVAIFDEKIEATPKKRYYSASPPKEKEIGRAVHIKINFLENLFLASAGSCIEKNVCLQKTLIKLYQRVHELHTAQRNAQQQEKNGKSSRLYQQKEQQEGEQQEFELNAACMLLPNWQEILSLHKLLCAIDEFDCFLEENVEEGNADMGLRKDLCKIRHSIIKLLHIANGKNNE